MFKLEKTAAIANILLVDDVPENLYSLEKMLAAKDRKFLKATSGKEALKLAFSNDVSLILLDVQMPEMNGFEVAEILKSNKRTAGISILFVTAISKEQQYVLKGYETGAVDYLFKPLDVDITMAKVKTFLQLYYQQNELQQQNIMLENLSGLVDNSMDITCIFDLETFVIEQVNQTFRTLLDYEVGEVLGSSLLNYFNNEDIEETKSIIQEELINNSDVFVFENVPGLLSACPGGAFVTERIYKAFDKIGYAIRNPELLKKSATGYVPKGNGSVVANFDHLDGVTGDKGIYSTVEDMFLWDQALNNEKVVKLSSLEQAFTPQHTKPKVLTTNYGLGWRMKQLENGEWLTYHTGWWHGFKNYYLHNPKDNSAIIILGNNANQSLSKINIVQSILACAKGGK